MTLAAFYHLHPTGNWRMIYASQMHRLCASGLYSALDYVHMGINSSERLDLPFSLPKVRIKYNQDHTTEFDTLYSMHDFCQTNFNCKALYFHAKGISHKDDPREANILAWREYMEYFVLDNWRECVKLLDNWDCVGTEYGLASSRFVEHDKEPHYSGNFWWTTGKYMASLDKKYLEAMKRIHPYPRTYGEFWIGTKSPRAYSFHCHQNLKDVSGIYDEAINPLSYMRK